MTSRRAPPLLILSGLAAWSLWLGLLTHVDMGSAMWLALALFCSLLAIDVATTDMEVSV